MQKLYITRLSVLLEECTGCHKNPEEVTSNSVEGHMEEVTGKVMFGWILKDV